MESEGEADEILNRRLGVEAVNKLLETRKTPARRKSIK